MGINLFGPKRGELLETALRVDPQLMRGILLKARPWAFEDCRGMCTCLVGLENEGLRGCIKGSLTGFCCRV